MENTKPNNIIDVDNQKIVNNETKKEKYFTLPICLFLFQKTLLSAVIMKMFYQKTGHFLELVELMANMIERVFLKTKNPRLSKRVSSYLSKRIQDEFIFS